MNSAGLIGFEELPREIRGQLDSITELWKRQLGEGSSGCICTVPSRCTPFGRNGVIWIWRLRCVFHYSDFRKAMC